MFRHTEKMELIWYTILGVLMALTPIFLSLRTHLLKGRSKVSCFQNTFRFTDKFWAVSGTLLSVLIFNKLYDINALNNHLYHVFQYIFLFLSTLIATAFVVKLEAKSINLALIFLFIAFSLVVNFSTAFIGAPDQTIYDTGLLHHWSAYLSSVKSMDSGFAIFNDFPTQYGLGPTLTILAFSSWGWITGMFFAVGALNFLFWFCLAGMAIYLVRRKFGSRTFFIFVTLLLITGTSYFWHGRNSYVSLHPSLGGMRFFPATLLASLILFLEISPETASTKRVWAVHFSWIFGFLWSIESALFVSLIWWPYFLFIKTEKNDGLKGKFGQAFSEGLKLLGIALSVVLLFTVIYFFIYGIVPNFSTYKIFTDYVIGTLLIDFNGRFIFSVFIFVFALICLVQTYKKHGANRDFLNLFVLIMLPYSGFSYYIGRSADYNILPLLPFFSLILIQTSLIDLPKTFRWISLCLLVASSAYTWIMPVAFPLQTPTANLHFEPTKLNKYFDEVFANIASEKGKTIHYIQSVYSESVIVYDPAFSLVLSNKEKDWNTYNNATTYLGFPADVQKVFVSRSKEHFKRSGWVLFEKATGAENIKLGTELFLSSYRIDKILPFGSFLAYRFVPKN